jgi:hypothetical protein
MIMYGLLPESHSSFGVINSFGISSGGFGVRLKY